MKENAEKKKIEKKINQASPHTKPKLDAVAHL